MVALENWFRLCGFDKLSADVDEVARLTLIGNDLLDIADQHLKVLMNVEKPEGPALLEEDNTPEYNRWISISAQMAAELYLKTDNFGLDSRTSIGNTEKYDTYYSQIILNLIRANKKMRTMS